jgi:hypothetical protein
MISLEKIRELEPDCDLTDEQLEELRADMYGLADMAFDKWIKDKNKQ